MMTRPAIEKHPDVIALVAEAEENGGARVDDQADERQVVGRNLGKGQAIDDLLEDDAATTPEGPGPAHWATSFVRWIVFQLQ